MLFRYGTAFRCHEYAHPLKVLYVQNLHPGVGSKGIQDGIDV